MIIRVLLFPGKQTNTAIQQKKTNNKGTENSKYTNKQKPTKTRSDYNSHIVSPSLGAVTALTFTVLDL